MIEGITSEGVPRFWTGCQGVLQRKKETHGNGSKKALRFSSEFKKKVALEALREQDTVQRIASRHKVHPNQVSAWKRQAVEGLSGVFEVGGKRGEDHEEAIRDLHAKIGELTVERDFFLRGLGR